MTKPGHLAAPAPLEGGGRVELRLQGVPDTAEPHYEARWYTSEGEFHGSAAIDGGGEAQVTAETADAPAWLLAWTGALLRLIARDHQQGAAWPRRLTRWRSAPEG